MSSQAVTYDEDGFAVRVSKRKKMCEHCRNTIQKGQLRIGPYWKVAGVNESVKWLCMACFHRPVGVQSREVDGYSDLPDEFKAEVDLKFSESKRKFLEEEEEDEEDADEIFLMVHGSALGPTRFHMNKTVQKNYAFAKDVLMLSMNTSGYWHLNGFLGLARTKFEPYEIPQMYEQKENHPFGEAIQFPVELNHKPVNL